MRSAGCTDVGKVRDENEDAYWATSTLLAVADGMGGHDAGDLAAAAAIAKVRKCLAPPLRRPRATLAKTFALANAEIRRVGSEMDHERMGTTLTVAVIRDKIAWIGHVGDSRAYLLRNGKLRQLTQDHSLVAELVRTGQIAPDKARLHPKRNVITRAVGSDKKVEPDIFSLPMLPGDRLILCSDGLTGGVDDRTIAELASPTHQAEDAAQQLIAAANNAGGTDNITVVIGDIEADGDSKSRTFRLAALIVGAAIVGLALWAGGYWLDHNYYLTIVKDRVAINRGLPGSPAGYKLGRLDSVTSVRVSDLPDYYRARLEQEMVVGSSKRLKQTLADIEGLARRKR